jgi:hypothetical protein
MSNMESLVYVGIGFGLGLQVALFVLAVARWEDAESQR